MVLHWERRRNKTPFLAIQEGMTPWFIHIPWERAIVDEAGGMLYLTCAEQDGMEDLTIAIKGRKKIKSFHLSAR